MWMLLNHPRIPACETCLKYVVDYDFQTGAGTGRIEEYGPKDNRQKKIRLAGCPPLCKQPGVTNGCPKGSPEREQQSILSAKNWRALEFYRAVKATFGRGLEQEAAADEIVQRNFALLDRIFQRQEQERLANTVSGAVTQVMLAAGLLRVK